MTLPPTPHQCACGARLSRRFSIAILIGGNKLKLFYNDMTNPVLTYDPIPWKCDYMAFKVGWVACSGRG